MLNNIESVHLVYPCAIIACINKSIYNNIVTLVENIIESQKFFHASQSDSDKKLYQQKIDLLDKQIDELVYQLYGLSEEEIRIVEEGV